MKPKKGKKVIEGYAFICDETNLIRRELWYTTEKEARSQWFYDRRHKYNRYRITIEVLK